MRPSYLFNVNSYSGKTTSYIELAVCDISTQKDSNMENARMVFNRRDDYLIRHEILLAVLDISQLRIQNRKFCGYIFVSA